MTNIYTQAGQPLDHVFVTSAVANRPVAEELDHHHDYQYEMEMRITLTNGDETILYSNVGLHEGLRNDGTVVIAASIHDSTVLGVGIHEFEINATDHHGNTILNDFGIIEVRPPDGTENVRKEMRPWDLLDTREQRVSKEQRNDRLVICKECPFYKLGMCTKCGCVMAWKTTLANAYCPENKWGEVL